MMQEKCPDQLNQEEERMKIVAARKVFISVPVSQLTVMTVPTVSVSCCQFENRRVEARTVCQVFLVLSSKFGRFQLSWLDKKDPR